VVLAPGLPALRAAGDLCPCRAQRSGAAV